MACNDRCTWVQFLDQVDMPVIVQRQVCSLRGDVVDAQMQIPMVCFTTEILQLQYIDKVVVVCCAGPAVRAQLWETVEIPQLQPVSSLDKVQSAENCEGPAVAAHLTRWLMTLLPQFNDGSHVPVIMQRRLRRWQCLRFRSSPESVDNPVAQQRMVLDVLLWRFWRRWRVFFRG